MILSQHGRLLSWQQTVGGLTSNTATVIVNLTDIADENPQFSQSVYYINVIENTIPMTPVLTANVTYPEMCFSQSFSIFVAEGVPFTIDNDGVIRVGSETLDRESEDMYSFNIIVECLYYLGLDLTFNPIFDSRFDSAEIRVTITDDNEVPSFPSNHYVGTVSETAPLNTTVLIITATDHDLGDNGEIRYRISDDMLIPSFDIEPVSGVVFVSDSLDHETDELHVFEIDAFDLGTPSLSASVTVIVAILDDNDSPSTFVCDAPDNICIFNVSIPENTPTNASIITLRTSDPDDVGTISFQLTSSDFLVTSSESSDVITEGIIRTSGPLDRETQDSYTFEVIVSDGIHTDTSLLIVNITDINDEYPVFQDENFEVGIRENYPTHVIFTSVNATDKDEGVNAEITYTILDSPLINTISINSTTGDVFFLVSPDYEESNRIELNIQATDTGGLQDFATMVINILDENDNAPVFSEVNYTATIYENLPDGTDVRYVVATDRDSDLNGLVTYSLGNESNEYFQINPTTGLIKSKAPVNKEANDSFVLIVTAKDLGQDPLSVESTVLITVLDVNDNAPEFSSPSYTAEISEEASIGTIVLTVYVTDIDEGSNAKLIFDLTGPNNDDFIYEVIPNGVNITVAQNLNHESISEYQLSLRAIDGGIPSQESAVSISIYVIDENDNTPSFQFPKYKYEVPENTAIGSIIGTVSAVDFDSKDSNLTYSFLNHVDDFSINYQTGEISVRYQLDHENVIEYIFTVIAKEQRAIPNTAQTIVEITIQDINDNPPEFICTQNSLCPMRNLSIYENKHPNVLETFHVRDLDSVTNINAITFDIGSGDTDEEGNTLFSIDPLSGELSVLVSLDREAREVYYIEVTATDNGVPSLVGTSHVTLIVKDVNDNHPVGKEQHVYAYMKDGRLGSTNFGRIAFSDKDIANNHLFTIQNLPSSFVVDTQGQLSIDSSSLTPNIYELTVVINDTLYNDTIVSTTSIVTIEVKNVSMETEDDTITMLISDMTPEVFITEHLILFQTEVTSLLLEIVDDFTSLFVYSITKSLYSYNTTELSLSAILHDKTYLHKDILKYLLHIYRGGIESSTSISILTEDLDFCSMEPCSFNGLCFVDIQYELPTIIINKHTTTVYHGLQPERQVQCTCVAGHTGLTCSDNQSSCDENTCHNGAHCIDIPYVTGCLCTQGYIGESCDISYPSHDLCTPSPCSNGATCTYSDVGYTCTCPTGFTGKTCNTSTDTELYGCYGNPCLHGAECIWDDLSISSYYCNCSSDYKGTRCQTFIYDCSSECDGCVYSPIGSTCITTPITCNELECPLTSSCVQDGNKAVCIDDCNPNPCQNGGQCVYQSPGYYCVCSLKYSGLNCELTTATFNGSSYALFPSLPLVSNGVISLDFITEDEDGVLLFTGRVDTQTNDYLLLHIKNGSVECVISFGGEPSTLRINDFSVNDQYWYTVTIFYSPMNIGLSVTRYESPYLHRQQYTTIKDHYYLDVTTPIFVGNLPFEFQNPSPHNTSSYTGCIRDVIVNGDYLDFSKPLLQEGSSNGCLFTDRNCAESACDNSGVCVGHWVGFQCLCSPDYAGNTCSEVSDSAFFTGNNYIQYEVIMTSDEQRKRETSLYTTATTVISLSFSTTSLNGVLVQMGNNNSDHIIIKIANGYLMFQLNLGGGVVTSQINTVTVNNGSFHDILFTRRGTTAELLLDNMYISRSVTSDSEMLLDILHNEIYIGAFVLQSTHSNGYQGCIYGIKLDNNDMPVNGANEAFIATSSNGEPIQPCTTMNSNTPSFFAIFESLYILVGVVLAGLLILSCTFVILCKCTHYCYTKQKGSFPVQERTQFIDTNSSIETPRLYRYQGSGYGLQPTNSFEQLNVSEEHELHSPDATLTRSQAFRSSKRQLISSPQRPKLFSKIPKKQQSPTKPIQRLDPMTGMPIYDDHQRRPSSVATTSSSDEDIEQYIKRKVEEINAQIADEGYDEVHVYNEEGPFVPIDSIGSLYDIVTQAEEDEEEEEEVRIVKMEIHSSSEKQQVVSPSQLHVSHSVSPRKIKIGPKIQHLKDVISTKPYDIEKQLLSEDYTDDVKITNHSNRLTDFTGEGRHRTRII